MNPVGHESFETALGRWLGGVPSHWHVTRLKNVADYWVSNVDKVAAEGEEPSTRRNGEVCPGSDRRKPSSGNNGQVGGSQFRAR
jgi:hypothetical protein